MSYYEWKKKTLQAFRERLLEAGFVPDAVTDFLSVQEEVMDMAYQMGRKEEQDGGED